jgi:hypothetical protein
VDMVAWRAAKAAKASDTPAEGYTGKYRQGPAACVACGQKWRAVAPVAVTVLECPQCHDMTGLFEVHAEDE